MDDENSKSLNKYEFTKAMTDYMLGLIIVEPFLMMNSWDQSEDQWIWQEKKLSLKHLKNLIRMETAGSIFQM